MNQLKTIVLLGALSALLVAIGGAIGGNATWFFLALALAMNLGAYFFSDAIVLRMSGARVLDEAQAPALFGMVRELAERAGLPMPKVAIMSDPTPNAFATGRTPARAVVAVTEGLLRLADPRELRGVLAHELAHVQNRDTLVATIAGAAAAAITHIANVLQWGALLGAGRSDDEREGGGGGAALLFAFLAPIAAVMLQMGISRSREYLADESAAELTGDPLALASALAKLQSYGEQMVRGGAPAPQPVTASLSIVNPLAGGGIFRLFSTHPPIEARIERLRAIAARMGQRA
ncbi:MAG: M48 family metalloprotease [Phycisphaerales bacterium]|jgi:heat shock protein HtpX|nr:M48 family metalloprotease [Phycisphaerales bacterium]